MTRGQPIQPECATEILDWFRSNASDLASTKRKSNKQIATELSRLFGFQLRHNYVPFLAAAAGVHLEPLMGRRRSGTASAKPAVLQRLAAIEEKLDKLVAQLT
jgi:hypothetical protein